MSDYDWIKVFEISTDSAVGRMADLSVDMWDEIGPKFTCTECDALVNLFVQLGLLDHAAALAASHIEGDYEEDAHYVEGASREERP